MATFNQKRPTVTEISTKRSMSAVSKMIYEKQKKLMDKTKEILKKYLSKQEFD